MNENGNKLKLRTTQPPVGNEITFAQGVRVEISADAAGTQFFPFSVVNVSSNSRKLGAKGQINGMDLEDFFPDMAIRILRVTNPECGVREIRVQRNGRSLVQVTTAAAPSYTAMP
ncbi:MAG TPA: hypothetical protein VNO70_08785 [Blastocatellia bacterium]|nr:hypothetical protein [Blastocatellia bacterium]